ncbi:MAG TPA: dihydrolipoamide acetyltransferase family protein [Oligoflexia bacterium]|nr:dihydrolipoamide acetyltransferase family protein [Oligoflexia bacterium]HMR23974.1 dihydrolipoamide acetyltransferase family protein [Oligoflexia bacterium]
MANHMFNLPDIGEGVNEGEIVQWLVAEGDTVKEDQPLVEIMTDKATVEIASPVSGTVVKHAAPEGESVNVGSLLAEIATDGAATSPAKDTAKQETASATPSSNASSPAKTSSAPATNSNVISMPASTAQDGLVLASPATRKFAREQNIALASIPGTGEHGRVLRSDVEQFVASGGSSASAAAVQTVPNFVPQAYNGPLEERIKLRGIRKAIAKNMQLSKNTAAHFTHVNELEANELVRVRGMLKQEAADKGVKLTFLPFIIKAICSALKEYPKLNSSLDEDTQEIVIKHYYNIGIAVATKDDDLIVPVIKNADQKGLLQIAAEITELADKARNNKLSPEELQGGTFTLTSMGNDGGLLATPVINYPQVGILGFYKIADRVVVRDGQMVIRKIANLSVSIDHRVVDGMMGANFMTSVIRNLENPSRMML